jgi:hypothetical protein
MVAGRMQPADSQLHHADLENNEECKFLSESMTAA